MFHRVARYLRETGLQDYRLLQLKTDLSIRDSNDMLWWIFRAGENRPAAIAKFCDNPQTLDGARGELQILENLAPYGDGLGIPPVLFKHDGGRYLVFVMAIVPGKRLQNNLAIEDSRILSSQISLIEPWLFEFQSRVPSPGDAGTEFRTLLDSAADQISRPLFDVASQAAGELTGIRSVAVHGDFWAHNLLAENQRLSVVDWSTFHYGGILEDFFTFSTTAFFHHGRSVKESADIYWKLLFSSLPAAVQIKEASRRILARWKLPLELLRPLFLMFLIRRLMSTQFLDNPAWRDFASRYTDNDAPIPWAENLSTTMVSRA